MSERKYPVVMGSSDFALDVLKAMGLDNKRINYVSIFLGGDGTGKVTYTEPGKPDVTEYEILWRPNHDLSIDQAVTKILGFEPDERLISLEVMIGSSGPVVLRIHKLGDTRLSELDWSLFKMPITS